MEQKPVKIFALSTCGYCKAAKKLLDERNVRYEFTDVDLLQGKEREAALEEMRKHNPQQSFPTILIGDKVIVGYREDEIRKALGID